MRNLFYHIIDYKQIHPIQFWAIIIGVLFLFLASIYVIRKGIQKKRNSKVDVAAENRDNEIEQQDNKFQKFISKHKIVFGIILVQFIIILGFTTSLFKKKYSFNHLAENPAVSSSKYLFGIDISHYQGKVDWKEMRTSHHPIEYIFMRATMGTNGKDTYFKYNWKKAKDNGYLRGAYHYYRPNENSTQQFENYKASVNLEDGDFIPILDIEKESRAGRKNLRKGVLNWLKLAETEYGRKPMIYTGLHFYQHILKGYVDDYPLWIAAYSGKHRLKNVDWTFHQFTEKVIVKGIRTSVDGNDFKNDSNALHKMIISTAKTVSKK